MNWIATKFDLPSPPNPWALRKLNHALGEYEMTWRNVGFEASVEWLTRITEQFPVLAFARAAVPKDLDEVILRARIWLLDRCPTYCVNRFMYPVAFARFYDRASMRAIALQEFNRLAKGIEQQELFKELKFYWPEDIARPVRIFVDAKSAAQKPARETGLPVGELIRYRMEDEV